MCLPFHKTIEGNVDELARELESTTSKCGNDWMQSIWDSSSTIKRLLLCKGYVTLLVSRNDDSDFGPRRRYLPYLAVKIHVFS
jgi:hypothetical protein